MTEKQLVAKLKKAPRYKDELITFWTNFSDDEKNKFLTDTYVGIDSHRGAVKSSTLSPVQAVVEEFCHQKNRELLYNPELWKENILLEELSEGSWLK